MRRPKLIITRGLPGSGKTTRARAWVAELPGHRARVNRDDLRAQVHDGFWNGDGTERLIVKLRDEMIKAALRLGRDVICDDTNLPNRTVRDLIHIAQLSGAEWEIWDLTDVPVETCVERDAARENPVGERVIRERWKSYVAGRPHPLPVQLSVDDAVLAVPYAPPLGAPPAIIVDIDGTVALMTDRSPYDETRIHEDRPNEPVIAVVRALYDEGYEVIFCSGRTDACHAETESWLHEHVGLNAYGEPYNLFMRRAGDGRRDAVVKLEIFNEHIRHKYSVIGVFDDRRQVVDMWRSLGLTVFQVAEGNF